MGFLVINIWILVEMIDTFLIHFEFQEAAYYFALLNVLFGHSHWFFKNTVAVLSPCKWPTWFKKKEKKKNLMNGGKCSSVMVLVSCGQARQLHIPLRLNPSREEPGMNLCSGNEFVCNFNAMIWEGWWFLEGSRIEQGTMFLSAKKTVIIECPQFH